MPGQIIHSNLKSTQHSMHLVVGADHSCFLLDKFTSPGHIALGAVLTSCGMCGEGDNTRSGYRRDRQGGYRDNHGIVTMETIEGLLPCQPLQGDCRNNQQQ